MDWTLAALVGFAFVAGFVDAVVGGGGLIQVPALFVLKPELSPATLFGTNKLASIVGTGNATWHYTRRVQLPWRMLLLIAGTAFVFSFMGARAVSHLDPNALRPLIIVALVAVFIYTLVKKDFGSLHAPKLSPARQRYYGLAMGALMGFYDGFFGPGTGSFLVFAFVGLFGFSFLLASASAKVVNLATNAAALAWFIPTGHVLYQAAVPMAFSSFFGSWCGAHLAIKHGSRFVRLFFIGVVALLLARMIWDTLRG
ncbi:MAG: TSUP family transporter [Pseudomonadota bacterium]